MDKTILKEFAIDSRNKLIKEIENRASMIGITEEGIEPPLSESTSDMLAFDIKAIETYKIYGKEVRQYEKLVKELEKREENSDYSTAYETLIEEVAYTWFNRLIAVRFMEVNNYMPDRIRVLSSGIEGVNEPEIVTNYTYASLDLSDEGLAQLSDWQLDGSSGSMEKMFRYLFIKQCNALNDNLPELFEKTDDYAELLLTISYNDKDGVLYKLVHEIPEDYFDVETDDGNGQVEIIGWLYQYYNTEPKEEVDASKKKVDKNTLPAKTQLFTPDWIVRYMVQNSLGRLWIEKQIAMGSDKTEEELSKDYGWKYYLPEAEQINEVKIELKKAREDRKDLKIEDITFIDPSMGSGHILVYAFEIFMQFYLEEGYTARQAAKKIIENNLYGLDIDKRAYQLTYFAIMMKGRQYSRRILNQEIKNNLYYFIDSKNINLRQIDYLGGNISEEKYKKNIRKDLLGIVELFVDAGELGSIITPEKDYDFDMLYRFINNIDNKDVLPVELIGIENTQEDLIRILNLLEMVSSKYNIVVTNPPYLGSGLMGANLSKYVNEKYENSKTDLFAVFIEKANDLIKTNGYCSMITQQSWMFLYSYKELRASLLSTCLINNILHLGPQVFEEISGEVVQSSAFIMSKGLILEYKPLVVDLLPFKNSVKKEREYLNKNYKKYKCLKQLDFLEIPNNTFMYRLTIENIQKIFKDKLDNYFEVFRGPSISSISKNIRNWYEVNYNKINNKENNQKWILCDRSGSKLRWKIPVMNVALIETMKKSSNYKFQNKQCIIWPDSRYGTTDVNARFKNANTYIESGVNGIYAKDELDLYVIYALFNTGFYEFILAQLINGQHFSPIYIKHLPYPYLDNKEKLKIFKLTTEINKTFDEILKFDELYLKFKSIFLNDKTKKIESDFIKLKKTYIKGIELIENIETELYNMISEILRIQFLKNSNNGSRYYIESLNKLDYVKSFISYAVGCMFGRYSLDEEGLAYAGGEWDSSKYKSFKPVEDNVILITDEEYFEDDIVNRFVEFVKVAYGEETLEENLEFIADSLTGSGTSREKIRNYFLNKFFKDHAKTYKKTPIYWLYDSSAGKYKRDSHDGFKALIYMHRYDKDTTGKVRIDYLHKLQKEYEFRMDNLQYDIDNNKNAREVAASEKKLTKLTKQLKETKDYDEKIAHLALARIPIDLDDGVKVNYEKIQKDEDGNKLKILEKI